MLVTPLLQIAVFHNLTTSGSVKFFMLVDVLISGVELYSMQECSLCLFVGGVSGGSTGGQAPPKFLKIINHTMECKQALY